MKKRLGTIPKGLSWISEEHHNEPKKVEKQEDLPKPLYKNSLDHLVPAAKRGLSEELIRATFIVQQAYLEKIKAYAYWERMQIKEVFDEMCDQFFSGKKVRSIPAKKK